FAGMLAPAGENGARVQQWITNAREADLPRLHSFTRGPRPRHPDRHGGTHAAVSQRQNRKSQQDQDDQEVDVRTRWIYRAAPPHPPQLKLRSVTTESATEPSVG